MRVRGLRCCGAEECIEELEEYDDYDADELGLDPEGQWEGYNA